MGPGIDLPGKEGGILKRAWWQWYGLQWGPG